MIEQPQSQGFFVEFFVFFLAEKGVVGKLIFVVGLFFSQPLVVQANAASAPIEISQPSLTIGIPDTLVNPKDVIELQKSSPSSGEVSQISRSNHNIFSC